VGHQARGASTSLPSWANKNSPSALREPIEAAKEKLAQNFSDPRRQVTGFYDNAENSSESSSEDSSDSDSSSSSSGSSTDSSGSESGSDDDSSSSEDDNGNGSFIANAPPLVSTNGGIQNNQLYQPMVNQTNTSIPQPFKANTISYTASSDDDSSESDDDSSDESDSVPTDTMKKFGQKGVVPNPSREEGNLLGIMSTNGFSPGPGSRNTSSSSAMDDLKGLMMEPVKVDDPKIRGIDLERDSSAWTQFVRPELCGGLSVQARYIRGPSKENELRLRNIDPSNSNVVCLQLGFSNK